MSTSGTVSDYVHSMKSSVGPSLLLDVCRAGVSTSATTESQVGTIRTARATPVTEVIELFLVQGRRWRGVRVALSRTDTPTEVWRTIEGTIGGGYTVREPVAVRLWRENGEYVADASALNLHAFGEDPDEALNNLRERIVEEYEFLRSESDRLAPRMVAAYAALAATLEESGGTRHRR